MEPDPEAVARGHALYTRRTLHLYDRWVHGFSNPCLWRCPTEAIEAHYRSHLSENHLEAGVGTGYLLDRNLPQRVRRLALLDASRDSLDHAAKRLSRYRPALCQENLLEPLPDLGAPFDSIGLSYVLHCLPGPMEQKAPLVFKHLRLQLTDTGTLFGATILGRDLERPLLAVPAMALYNRYGIFSNFEDSLGPLMSALREHFKSFQIEVKGCVALFVGTKPKAIP